MSEVAKCWCGGLAGRPFSEEYLACEHCETLVYRHGPAPGLTDVSDAAGDYYGVDYWFDHQTRELGLPTVIERGRMDLCERAPHWLRTVLRYRTPPARVLEIGSGPGCLVGLLAWAGYDAVGLELSPWVVEHSSRTFGVPVVRGTVETAGFDAASFDVIAMMDVLEHLADPLGTVRRCVELLRPGGVLILQTPRYEEGVSFEALVERRSPFLQLLVGPEHLFLFSEASVGDLLDRAGIPHLAFEEAIYPQHDMYLVGSAEEVPHSTPEQIDAALESTPGGRLVRALLDAIDQAHALEIERGRHAAELEVFRRAADERLARLIELDSELGAERVRSAELEAAATARLAALEVAERHMLDAQRAHERAAALEAAADERLTALLASDARCREFEVAAAQRLESLERAAADLAAVSAELARTRAALELRDTRVLELERALDQRAVGPLPGRRSTD